MAGLQQADGQAYLGRAKSFLQTRKGLDEDSECLVCVCFSCLLLSSGQSSVCFHVAGYSRPGSSVSTRKSRDDGDSPEQLRKLLEKALKQNEELKAELREAKSRTSAEAFDEEKFQKELEEAVEASRATAGLSSSSRAGSQCASDGSDKAAMEDAAEDAEPVEEIAVEAANPAPSLKVNEIIPTSTSHRREYMQLSRKMEGIDPSKFPEVTALWSSGNKKERLIHA